MELSGRCAPVKLPARLTLEAVAQMTASVDQALAAAPPIVALVGAGDDTFCLGLALEATHEGEPATSRFADLLLKLHRAPKPLLAIVDGRAIGGGLGIAAACDWIVATEGSTFALPELLWGLVPAIIWPVIADRMAPHVARTWTVSARARSAMEAQAAGLVDQVVAPGSLEAAIARAERMLVRLETGALVKFREWTRTSRGLSIPDALGQGAAITATLLQRPAARARWAAFAAGDVPWA